MFVLSESLAKKSTLALPDAGETMILESMILSIARIRRLIWVVAGAMVFGVGCAGTSRTGHASTGGAESSQKGEATLTVSEIGLPYGAYVRVNRAEWPAPMQGYFHDYRDGKLVLSVGEATYDTGTVVEVIDKYHPETALCDTLERDGRWSIVNEGQWVSLYDRHGRSLARGRIALVLPDSLYVARNRVARDSVCRVEVAWRKTGERHQGLASIPVTVGKTVVKVMGVLPLTLYCLVAGDSQTLQRFMNW